MIAGQSVLAIIPARGGSKGVPRKNIRMIAGRPLLAWTVDVAKASQYIDRVILSSDDEEIIAAALAAGCEVPFRRPADLARDDTPGIAPVLHALGHLPHFDIVVLLQPTSPLREIADIDGCLERMISTRAPACVSLREADDHPYWTVSCDAQGRMSPFVVPPGGTPTRRQDLPKAFVPNGAVYAARVDWLKLSGGFETSETIGFEMPAARSQDIDSEDDLRLAEIALLRRNGGATPPPAIR
jgi:N-acylneuraminate cytidylyltransferase